MGIVITQAVIFNFNLGFHHLLKPQVLISSQLIERPHDVHLLQKIEKLHYIQSVHGAANIN